MLEGSTLVNYYEVLQVREGADPEEIKRSFRRLVKEYHPDTNGNQPWAEARVKLVIQAYKTLSDASHRSYYDKVLDIRRGKSGAGLRRWQNGVQSQVRMILLDLLDNNGARALTNYERLRKNLQGFHLLTYFTFKDYIDCLFLLAEESERQKRYDIALEFYEEAYSKLEERAKKQYLFEEIKDRIRRIYCGRLARRAQPREALLYYEKVLELDLFKSERAQVHKKMAECYVKLGDYYSASTNLNIALSLRPNLRGTQRIHAKLEERLGPNAPLNQSF